ncbi:hypothetical protein BKP45_04965 [Anaerobacillus alkalidiazotrophicus]|uniref:Uncharacterized protein n=1 Tax=Anaerobacillus alkalidiazotrophicus TaxID=472963 RepID=A0A1S2MBF5_9BACI|nr:hypothetical protein [Anaerobacillus alkalidiazotrophicus]OIJ22031.1 hypothetical protein BKP45_04965 [Anaerobacillus alkalidiazotrophicus]
MIDFSGISLPFGAGELLSGAIDLLNVVGPFVLLALAIYFAPRLFSLVYDAVLIKDMMSDDYRSFNSEDGMSRGKVYR